MAPSSSYLLFTKTKTEAMWIGSCRQNTATPLGLRWSKSVKALGVVFTCNDTDQLQKNFYDKLKDIRTQIRLWNCWGLSLFGKVTVIKSLLLPKMLYMYVFSVLTTPGEFIKQLNTIIYNFLWKGTDKIARLAAVNDLEYGGLNLLDLETYVKSSRLAWLGRNISYLLKDFGWAFLLILALITMSKTVKLFPLFIENFSNGGLT